MKAASRAAIKLYEYLGTSAAAARKTSKETAGMLSEMLAGKSRKEKKKFFNAIETLTDDKKNPKPASDVILKTLTKGKTGEEYFNSRRAFYELVEPLNTRRNLNSMTENIITIFNEEIDKMLKNTVAEASSPETINRIMKDILKQYLKDAKTILYRIAAFPVNLIRSFSIPSGKKNSLIELVHNPKENFAASYYSKILKQKGLTGRAPKQVEVLPRSAGLSLETLLGGKAVEGGFDGFRNKIFFTREFDDITRSVQANMITHELRHFEQADQIIRTFGIERYIQAKKTNLFKQFSQMSQYKNASPEEINRAVEDWLKKNNLSDDTIRVAFAQSISAPRINPNSVKGRRAQKYLEATENYTGISKNGIFTSVSKDYLENPMEVEAYAFGKEAGRQTRIIEALNLISI